MAAESESGLFAIRTVRAAMEMYGEDASWLAAPDLAAKAHRSP
jgi:hypothetical protein